MVRRALRISALDRKLLRDLWGMKGQALAIARVMAAGVAMFVMYLSNFDSLRRTQRAYYERSALRRRVRLPQARAPAGSRSGSRRSPAWPASDTRVVADVTLDVPGLAEPAHAGGSISIPADGPPAARTTSSCGAAAGSSPAGPTRCWPARPSSSAHRLQPGDAVAAVINGRRRALAHRRRRAVARVRLHDPAGGDDPRRPALRRRSGWSAARSRSRLRHGGRLQRRGAPPCARRVDRAEVDRPPRPPARPLRGPGRDPAGAADLQLDARQRAPAAPELRLPRARSSSSASRRSSSTSP